MAKIAMECPFSKKMCVDCAVYRGSHYFLCFKKEYRGCLLPDANKAVRSRNFYGVQDMAVDIPREVLADSNMIKNVEDIIEKEEFSMQRERAAKA